ncbi:Metallo-dependent phosphatase-like protein [Halteromyces radiatus]|uniref:Metallo-dependent phosphatase-like protein n=1 Tax=Halteromyces radiatus TaxID=101107 RepID=UPI00221E92B9|nr:Metallo-dependent phosphatase-like protein [Halteromyces radiatus]KAI8096209.1 Metallo-dependent phosphatase-like protein [Halteromyces radiatus]
MKILSRSTWLCLALIFLSILRSIHLNYISRQPLKTSSSQYQHTSQPSLNTASLHAVPDKPNSIVDDTLLSDDPSNLFYFIQVSDLHISKFRTQTQHFLHFIQSVLPIVRPSFVVVTGDLTDAKGIDGVKTQQYKEEWQLYQNAIDQGIEDDLPWYDMRGNHDCFDLPSWQSNINLYRTFGKSSQLLEEGKGVYSWQMNQSYGQYQFIAMDACPKKGPARPLNFYGYMPTNSMDRLESTLLDESTYNHTFLFTHYPTTTMIFGQSNILKSYDTTTKSLELELGDMKDHGVYRIMAVDDDLVSFVDVELPAKLLTSSTTHGDGIPLTENNTVIWPEKTRLAPIILITNPKDARFLLPGKEPIYRIRNSTHIRFLVFSDHDPHSLKVRIFVDNKHHPFPATYNKHTNSSLPLWTSSWSPEDFDDQITHSLGIQVTTPDGLVGESQVYFRVDGVQLKIGGGFGEWLIGTSVATLVSRGEKKSGEGGRRMEGVCKYIYIYIYIYIFWGGDNLKGDV